MTQLYIPLSQLRFGRDAVPPINCRRSNLNLFIPELAASISAHGQIQAMNVKEIEGVWYVRDGDRRLAAQQLRAANGEISIDEPIKCDDNAQSDTSVDMEELSLAANFMHLDPHEADVYETFHRCHQRGLSPESIAERFGVELWRVARWLKLGELSPLVLDAWRAGDIDVNTVRAFTLAPSVEKQDEIFQKLTAGGNVRDWVVLRELGAADHAAAHKLKCVGMEAYRAAGGTLVTNLFGDEHIIDNPELLDELMQKALDAECATLVAAGWKWATHENDPAVKSRYSWERFKAEPGKPSAVEMKRIRELELIINRPGGTADEKGETAELELRELQFAIDNREWTPATMARAGVIVAFSHDGVVEHRAGWVMPEATKTKADAKAKGEKPKDPLVSNALAHRLSVQATLATRAALVEEPRVGLVALLAGHVHGGTYGNPIRVRKDGYGAPAYDPYKTEKEKEPFSAIFDRLNKMDDAELFRIAADIAGNALDMQVHNAGNQPFAGSEAMAAAMSPERFNAAILEAFDAADYFTGVSAALVCEAIADCFGADAAKKWAKEKKKAVTVFAIANIPPKGWLPRELRTSAYTGPGATK